MRNLPLLTLLAILPASAASISGVVTDPSGAAVSQAIATLESPSGQRSASTDANGRFEFSDIAPGDYRISITHDGFEPYSSAVTAGATSAPLAIALRLAALKTVV